MGTQGSKSESGNTNTQPSRRNTRAVQLYRKICDDKASISGRRLLDYFPDYSRPLITRLFNVAQTPEAEITEEQFSNVLDKILAPRSSASLSQLYFDAFCSSGTLQDQETEDLISTAFRLYLITCDVSPDHAMQDREGLALASKTLLSKGTVEAGLEWVETHCQELLMGMHHWLLSQLSCTDDPKAGYVPESILPDHEGALLSVGMWWMLSSSLPSLYTQPQASTQPSASNQTPKHQTAGKQPWTLLYSSREHGLSVNRLQHHVLGYKGPTVLVVCCEGGYMYAVALDTEWREGTSPWGGSSCAAIRLAPNYSILEEGENMVLFNDKSRNLPKGLFIGRDPKRRLLSMTEGLEQAAHRGLTGSVHNAEVWGCASSDVKLAQSKQKKTELKDAERNAKVKLPGQWDDNPDRMLLEWGTSRKDYADAYREDRKN